MRSLSRVVWSEGMHLAQHHFQMQSRYFEDSAAFAISSLFFKPYGLAASELDADALLNGTVSVVYARGVMPDGLAFHFPEDPAPEPLEIRELFSPTHDSHLVLLAIPAYRPDALNCAVQPTTPANGARYRSVVEQVRDETTGLDEKPVAMARKNFRLILDTEQTQDMVSLPIARVRRDGSGRFIYDPAYVPPCLQIGASPRLLDGLRRTVQILEAQADAMQRKRQAAGELSDYAASEIAGFWLSHTVHSSLALLRHHLEARTAHPEQLFVELSRLAGALCTFSLESSPRNLPLYDHERLEECFEALDRHIRAHLEVVLPTRCVPVPLEPMEPYFYRGTVDDRRSFGKAHWFLGVRSTSGKAGIASDVPALVKVCSGEVIVKLVRHGMDGLALEHVASPPAAISPRIGTQYFRIQTEGRCWDSIVRTSEVGVYAPAAVGDVQLELLIALES